MLLLCGNSKETITNFVFLLYIVENENLIYGIYIKEAGLDKIRGSG